jgi:hypothetical protein
MAEQLRIVDLCQKIGLTFESIKLLLEGTTLIAKSFSFFSPEHNQKFKAEDVILKIERDSENSNKLRLGLNGMDILDWFGQKYQKFQKAISISKKSEYNKGKGFRR